MRTAVAALFLALVLFAGTRGQGPAAEPTPPTVEYVNAPTTGAPCAAPC
jgi:hypothetical protein